LAVVNVVDVRGPVLFRLPISRELVAREHDSVVIAGQHVFNLFPETTSCHLHSHAGKFIQPADRSTAKTITPHFIRIGRASTEASMPHFTGSSGRKAWPPTRASNSIRLQASARFSTTLLWPAGLDSTDKELMMEWMSGQAGSSDVPPRAGYYFDWRFATALGKTRTLPQLADFPDAQVRTAISMLVGLGAGSDTPRVVTAAFSS
jgi:hypothetical protein